MDKHQTVIGWREIVSLPEWGINRLRAKADTGARSSAVDVLSIEELDEGQRVRFEIALARNPLRTVVCEADVSRTTRVRATTGRASTRTFVRTIIRIGEIEKEVEIGLVCRKDMLCRMLLGRNTLAPEFIVDVSAKYLTPPPARRRKEKPRTDEQQAPERQNSRRTHGRP